MGLQATLAGLALVAAALFAILLVGGDEARATCQLNHSPDTCFYALR